MVLEQSLPRVLDRGKFQKCPTGNRTVTLIAVSMDYFPRHSGTFLVQCAQLIPSSSSDDLEK